MQTTIGLTDFYQVTAGYAMWKNGIFGTNAVFDLYIRKAPFGGEFCVAAGLSEALKILNTRFSEEVLAIIEQHIPDPEFVDMLRNIDFSDVRIHAVPEGTVIGPNTPIIKVTGPLGKCQILETPLLNIINFASLVATNAARMVRCVPPNVAMVEFGARRAQGPDGAVSATRYAYMGGFQKTSNLQASALFVIPVTGTHPHSWVQSFKNWDSVKHRMLAPKQGGDPVDFVERVRATDVGAYVCHEGELAAFTAYAIAHPDGFLALVDTYGTLSSGIHSYCRVAIALTGLGYVPRGIRIDSGDLAYLSVQCRRIMNSHGLTTSQIVASNDINESVLQQLQRDGHKINAFGIGTNLVTCQSQPALGGVFKLCELDGEPRIKVSNDAIKTTVPGSKEVFRVMDKAGMHLVDVLALDGHDQDTIPGRRCHHINGVDSAIVMSDKVERLMYLAWDGRTAKVDDMDTCRGRVKDQLAKIRPDVLRSLNPTPFKVAMTTALRDLRNHMIDQNKPVGTLE